MQYISRYLSPLGPITIASDGESLIGLWFDGQKYDRASIGKDCIPGDNLDIIGETRRWLDIYFSGREPDFTPKMKVAGSTFKKMVAEIMLAIPYGKTTTYGDIAQEVARRMGRDQMSAQAVGGAVGHNAISIIIPCHRVLGTDGNLTGYAGGLDRKKYLLKMEKAI